MNDEEANKLIIKFGYDSVTKWAVYALMDPRDKRPFYWHVS